MTQLGYVVAVDGKTHTFLEISKTKGNVPNTEHVTLVAFPLRHSII